MLTIETRNVQQALPEGCRLLAAVGVRRGSRNGPVLQMPDPLTTVYSRPTERVLFWRERDANPFFHLMEALWMLAGRNDLGFVQTFASNMNSYSDDGATLNGAYGYRWRHHFGVDQLSVIATALRERPEDRRQVLAMWDGSRDLLNTKSRDVPCNTTAFLQRNASGELDLMVCNRSNDLIWGAYGANAVHFSVMQEFVARAIGCPMGRYWQTSMNTHAYVEPHGELIQHMASEAPSTLSPSRAWDPYSQGEVSDSSLCSLPAGQWLRELGTFLKLGPEARYEDPFFSGTAVPMVRSFIAHKGRDYDEAMGHARSIAATDWRWACIEWVQRRKNAWTSKNE